MVTATRMPCQKTPRAGMASENSGEKMYFAVLRETVNGFIVHAFVNEVTIHMVQAPDGVHILKHADLVFQSFKALF